MSRFFPETLFNYIFKRVITSFLLFLIITSTILVLVSFIQYADIFITTNISFLDIIKVLLLMFPLSIEFALPLSVIASLMYLIYVMEVNNEILALELTGFSRYILSYPILIFAILIFLLNLIFSLVIFPLSITNIKKQAMTYAGNNIKDALIENKINDDIPDTMIYFKSRDNNDKYQNLYVFQRGDNNNNLIIYSKESRLDFGKELSIEIDMNNGKIIDIDNGLMRNILFEQGRLNIDMVNIIEKKVKNIRGFYGGNTLKDKTFYLFDGIYLSFVNIWVCLIGIIIFMNKSNLSKFFKYVIFLMFIGLYYVGFRGYHSLYEGGFLKIAESFFSVLLLMSLFLIFLRRIFMIKV